jgi:hypothetical protein
MVISLKALFIALPNSSWDIHSLKNHSSPGLKPGVFWHGS